MRSVTHTEAMLIVSALAFLAVAGMAAAAALADWIERRRDQ